MKAKARNHDLPNFCVGFCQGEFSKWFFLRQYKQVWLTGNALKEFVIP